ncbi:polyamine aminopropyltransferase [bacterium]|nr:polyamine aminopropyltransferase [bacterium]MCI0603591.1 polyamine aminopropyltransferase [bacterium]
MPVSELLPETPVYEVKREASAGVTPRREILTLLASIFLVAACGLIYELLIATASSYLVGSSVTQFSISIGVFIGSMGLGSYFSQRVRGLLTVFIGMEIVLAIVGGLSVLTLYWSYPKGAFYWVLLLTFLVLIGGITGLELPLLTRYLKRYGTLRKVMAQALSFDYIGALAGSLLFPLILLPELGMIRTAFLVAIWNVAIAIWNIRVFGGNHPQIKTFMIPSLAAGGALVAGFLFSGKLIDIVEKDLYEDQIIYSRQTPYQKIIVTRWREDVRLFLDGNLQFSSVDEYRYHEALVHTAFALSPVNERVLILGGGDGLAAREILKYKEVKQITLVDIDPAITDLAQNLPPVVALNQNSLQDARVRMIHQDAHAFLQKDSTRYDVIISDLPDPNTEALAKLFSVEFFRLIKQHLSESGAFVAQATSPYFAREAFWCIVNTVKEADLQTAPFHVYVPSFGDWGFVIASHNAIQKERMKLRASTRFLSAEVLREMFYFPNDESEVPAEVSTLDHPAILNYYLAGWKRME